MQPIDVINASAKSTPPSSTDRTGSSKLGKDEFVKLLMTQLKNQDPTAPSDSQAFVAQLAHFSSVEQLNNVNSSLDDLLLGQAVGAQTQAASLIGKQVEFQKGALQLGKEGDVTAGASLGGDAADVSVAVLDRNGKTVRTLSLGAQKKGLLPIKWNGLDNEGKRSPAGDYSLRVTARDSGGKTVPAETRTSGMVTGVSFDGGAPVLVLGTQKIGMNDVISISQPATQTNKE